MARPACDTRRVQRPGEPRVCGARRRRCRAQRAARPAVGDIDLATVAPPEEVIAAAKPPGSRSADRHRPWHHHRGRRARALRGDHAAPGRGDARPPRHRGLHRRLDGGRPPARFHDQRALLRAPTAPCSTRSTAIPISPRAACASSATPGAHPRGLPAHPALLPLPADFGEGPPDADGLGACVAERDGLAHPVGGARALELLRLLAARAGPRSSPPMQDYGLSTYVLPRCAAPTVSLRRWQTSSGARLAPIAGSASAPWRWRFPRTPIACATVYGSSNEEHARIALSGHHPRIAGTPDPSPALPSTESTDGISAAGARSPRARIRPMPPTTHSYWRDRFTLPKRSDRPVSLVRSVMAPRRAAGPTSASCSRRSKPSSITSDFPATRARFASARRADQS